MRVTGVGVPDSVVRKLARRGIHEWEPVEVAFDRPRFLGNKKNRTATHQMIGSTKAGRLLTMLIKESGEPGDWYVVTGRRSTEVERSRYEGRT